MYPNAFRPLMVVTASLKQNANPTTVAASTVVTAATALPGRVDESDMTDIRIENQTNGWAYCTFGDINVANATTTNGIAIAPLSVEVLGFPSWVGFVSVILSAAAVSGNVRFTRGIGI